jgi:hypothetical protein
LIAWLQDLGLVFDVAICLLLVMTIGYAMALNRKLGLLRDAKRDMEKLFAEFASATNEAQGGLQALKQHSGEAGENLARNVDDACRLADEMAFLVKKGNEIANRLESAIAASRKASVTAGAGGEASAARAETAPTMRAQAPSIAKAEIATPAAARPAETPAPRGLAKLTKRKLSDADSELMRALQAIR